MERSAFAYDDQGKEKEVFVVTEFHLSADRISLLEWKEMSRRCDSELSSSGQLFSLSLSFSIMILCVEHRASAREGKRARERETYIFRVVISRSRISFSLSL